MKEILLEFSHIDKGSDNANSDNGTTEDITPDLSRRNTIVVPPTLEQVEQELESGEGTLLSSFDSQEPPN